MQLDGLPSTVMPPTAMILTIDVLTQKLIITCMNQNTSAHKSGWSLHWSL